MGSMPGALRGQNGRDECRGRGPFVWPADFLFTYAFFLVKSFACCRVFSPSMVSTFSPLF
jgi:hypothetical protein